MTRLVTALEAQDHLVVAGHTWPPRSNDLGRVISEREAILGGGSGGSSGAVSYQPSGTAQSTFMPFRPVSSNPLKKLEAADWNLYLIDAVGAEIVLLPRTSDALPERRC